MRADFVQAGPVKLQYFEHGAGPELLVLVHGYQSSGRIWRLVQEALDPTRFRSLALSNRGAGDSERTAAEADYTVESFAQDLSAATQTLGLRDFTLVGHSMGGATVTQCALDHPELLKALVLLNPAPLAGRTPAANWEQQIREQFAKGRATENVAGNAPHVPEEFRRPCRPTSPAIPSSGCWAAAAPWPASGCGSGCTSCPCRCASSAGIRTPR